MRGRGTGRRGAGWTFPVLPILILGLLAGPVGCGQGEAERERQEEAAAEREEPRPAGERAARAGSGEVTVPPSTSFQVRLDRELGAGAVEGDSFTVTTTEPLRVDGVEAVPAGVRIDGTVTAVQEMEDEKRPGVVKVDFRELEHGGERIPIYVSVVDVRPEVRAEAPGEAEGGEAPRDTAARSLLGTILVGDGERDRLRETVAAASGTAIVLGVPGTLAVLPAGSTMTLRLDTGLTLKPATEPSSR